jgi:hypothetical protein
MLSPRLFTAHDSARARFDSGGVDHDISKHGRSGCTCALSSKEEARSPPWAGLYLSSGRSCFSAAPVNQKSGRHRPDSRRLPPCRLGPGSSSIPSRCRTGSRSACSATPRSTSPSCRKLSSKRQNVGEHSGDTMLARIAVMRALHRNMSRSESAPRRRRTKSFTIPRTSVLALPTTSTLSTSARRVTPWPASSPACQSPR